MTQHLNILFAEDNPADAELVLRHLRRGGFDIEVNRVDTEEAFRAGLHEGLDLVLSDYDLGPFNGLRALELLKASELHVPFILISGTIGEDLAVEAIKMGASDYLLKDRLVRLGAAVTQAIMESRLRRERRQAEVALALSESRYRLLVEHAADGIFTVSGDGRYTDVNARALEMLHYERDDFLRIRLGDLIAPEDLPRMGGEVAALRQGESRVSEFRIRRKDGSWFDAEIAARALPDGQLMGIVRDLTERRRAEQALRESEARFRQLAENIKVVFWMADPDRRRILYASPAYESIWDRSCESLCRAPASWIESIHAEDRDRVLAARETEKSGGYDETYRIIRPDGGLRWIRERTSPIRDAAGQVYRIVGTAEDITDWRRLEEQYRQAQKLEAIGTLAGGIAHDFNNILAAIIGYVELSQMKLGPSSPVHKNLEHALQGAQRASLLVRQILAFSRQQEHQRMTVQLRHVVSEPLKLLRATLPTMIEFDVNLAADLPPVQADPTQIHQVVMNLCTNAAHAMKDRPGRLTVRLEKFLMDASRPKIAGVQLKPGLYVKLLVRDTGSGMDRTIQDRIFEPFFTTKGPGEGTGLGLSVVHGIVQSHEGEICVQSQPGEGTTFQIFFPASSAVPEEKRAPDEVNVPRGAGQRVLFIDDEQPLAQLGQSILDVLGYRAMAVSGVAEAIACVESDPQAFDLVITDLSMPGMKGTDLAGYLLKLRPGLPIILITGFTAKLTHEAVREMGIRELLIKPFNLRSLGMAVHRVLSSAKP